MSPTPSPTARNIATAQSVYAAFGRGDVPAILEVMRPDVDWEFGRADVGAPWLAPGRGREHVMAFFQALGGNLEVRAFEVLTILADGPWVVALVRFEGVHRTTGKILVETCEPHVWRFDDEGRVAAMKHAADSYHHWRVCQPT